MSAERTLIIGVPRAGKTTLARTFECDVMHTDDLISVCGWSQASDVIAGQWMTKPGPWVIDGVAGVRALRKFLTMFPGVRPCERVIWMGAPRVDLTPGQVRMAKGCETIWHEIWDEVVDLKCQIEVF